MTREAFNTYGRVLAPHGLLMVHISNKFLDLEPVVSSAAKAGGWYSAKLIYDVPPPRPVYVAPSFWVAMSRDPAVLAALKARNQGWQPMARYPGFTPWSDDYSTILPLVKAFH
jgi:hypothetical protein